MRKYELLAAQLASQIEKGVWLPGEKLPSLRKQAEQSGYSLMTVLHAYQMLESQGVLAARERSGYSVSASVSVPQGRSRAIQPTEAVSVNDFVFEVLQASRNIHTLSLGFAYPDPALFPRQQLNKAVASAAKQISLMAALDNLPPGNEALRQLIAKRYAARGVDISPDEIVITAGALEALSLSLQAATRPGDWVVIEAPAFYGAMQTLERLGLKAVSVEVDPEHGLDLASLERAFQAYDVKACWLMSNFQNPIGYSLSNDKKLQLAQLLANYQVVLIEDDVYGELYEGDVPPVPVKQFDCSDNVMLCSSFSKSLVAGFRLGWVAAGSRALDVQKRQLMSTLATSTPIQLSLVEYLSTKNYEKHLKTLRKTLAARKKAMHQFLSQLLKGIATIHCHSGGYFLWLEFDSHVDTTSLYREALDMNITVAPGKLFTLNDAFSHCLRINASFQLTESSKALLQKFFQQVREHVNRSALS
ncbi:PLP-dependent aminotransferase family protein [Aliidiomarina soli]|uniref:GntR family transcriptional regulator n=1 Tax=Aliidiomarina soli TaxID=1928574 RepID=A0A432WHE4_9GAMM|nr:PLP-dependent aminotransferase family protein [Aliidiomarina soli]RUO33183.1 GntR family transcriptional regulator [Aliidiomarina soli]